MFNSQGKRDESKNVDAAKAKADAKVKSDTNCRFPFKSSFHANVWNWEMIRGVNRSAGGGAFTP